MGDSKFWRKQPWWLWAAGSFLVALLLVVGIGAMSSDTDDLAARVVTTTTSTPSTTAVEPTSTTASPSSSAPATAPRSTAPLATSGRCIPVDRAMLNGIATGLDPLTTGVLSNGWAVKSSDYKNVYMIAAVFRGAGFENVGVWASNSLQPGGGLIMAVDGYAQEFSDWGDGDKTDARIRSTDDGVSEAKKCAD